MTLETVKSWCWRDGLVVKSFCGFSRGPGFNFQQLYRTAHNSLLNSSPGDPMPSSILTSIGAHTCDTQIHIKKNNNKSFKTNKQTNRGMMWRRTPLVPAQLEQRLANVCGFQYSEQWDSQSYRTQVVCSNHTAVHDQSVTPVAEGSYTYFWPQRPPGTQTLIHTTKIIKINKIKHAILAFFKDLKL